MNKKIVLDVDGVILDYNKTYQKIYEKTFSIKAPRLGVAYHAKNEYKFHEMSKKELALFYGNFTLEGWANMEPLPNVIEALTLLKNKEFEIYCVTSIPPDFQNLRKKNLESLGDFFTDIICCGRTNNILDNPKKVHIEKIKPQYFVDDLLDNFKDIQTDTEFVFIDKPSWDSPNTDSLIKPHHTHNSLFEFVQSLEQKAKFGMK